MNDKKTKVVTFRVTEKENQMLLELIKAINSNHEDSKKINKNQFLEMLVRNAISLTPDFLQPELKELKETNKQLLALGRNLNQISRSINTGKANAVDQLTEKYLKTMSAYIVLSRNEINAIIDHNQKRGQIKLKIGENNG